jgi:hypothetical protein
MINEQELIKLGFEWDEDSCAWSIEIRRTPPDELLQQENFLLCQSSSGGCWIQAKWADEEKSVIFLGHFNKKDLVDLIGALKRGL